MKQIGNSNEDMLALLEAVVGIKNEEKNQVIQTNKKPALKKDNTIITQQFRPKSNKPKLGL